MNDSQNVIKASSMPTQPIKPLQVGATSPMASAQIQQQQNINAQMALIGKSGGAKRKRDKRRSRSRKLKGGTAVLVPPVPPGSVNHQQTTDQYAALTSLAEKQSAQAVYDSGKTAAVASKQSGGSWPNWRCLSGGKSRHRNKNKGKTRKTRKTRKMRRKL